MRFALDRLCLFAKGGSRCCFGIFEQFEFDRLGTKRTAIAVQKRGRAPRQRSQSPTHKLVALGRKEIEAWACPKKDNDEDEPCEIAKPLRRQTPLGTAARPPAKTMKQSSQEHMQACLAYEATLRKIGALASSAAVDLKSTVEHVDLHVAGSNTAAVHVYSIETDYVETTNVTGSIEHYFSISVQIDEKHYAADVFVGESGQVRWNGEIVEFHNGVPLRSFCTTVAPASW
jgi:hypothetical protein